MQRYNIKKVWRYCGAKLAVAELVAAVDFGEPQRVAKGIADPSERLAFEQGISTAYEQERIPPELRAWARRSEGWADEFYSALMAVAYVS